MAKFPAILKEAGAHALVLDLDASDETVKATAEQAIAIFGHVDVLVNNAGSGAPGKNQLFPRRIILRPPTKTT